MTPAEAALAVADAMERDESLGFDMEYFYEEDHSCGTVACIAGWTCLTLGEVSTEEAREWLLDPYAIDWDVKAAGILGLTPTQSHQLFYTSRLQGDRVTRKTAIHVLREYARTGEVVWPKRNVRD